MRWLATSGGGMARLLTRHVDYRVDLARSTRELTEAQLLRYEVFNLELGEGLAESHVSGCDADVFDAVCDHLLVREQTTGAVVGTYRLQTGHNAAACLGYYSEQEFDLSAFEGLRGEILELGRACVQQQHRNLAVIGLLWRGLAQYAQRRRARYLIGCSSLTSQDPREGASAYSALCRRHLAPPHLRTRPQPGWECPLAECCEQPPGLPKLLRAYLSMGAQICGPPALDRQFKTIDFLTLMDLDGLPAAARERFFG